MSSSRCYLDYNATTPLSDAARNALVDALDVYGNPSSVHQEGRAAKALLEKARRQVAKRLHTEADHVVFTSGATEAAMTLLTPHYKMGRSDVSFSKVYIGATEHPCIGKGGRFDKDRQDHIGVDENGIINIEELEQKLARHDKSQGLPMVAIQAANGETGVIQPIGKIADVVKQSGGVLIVDIVQYIGKLPVNIESFGGDFFIVAAHKIGGPKGVGAFVATGSALMPEAMILGGGQEKGFRSGTESIPLIASFGAAMEQKPTTQDLDHSKALQMRLENGLRQLSNKLVIYGEHAPRLPNTTYFAIKGLKAETVQIGLDLAGFAVSAGSACSSGKVKQSGVLEAMGYHVPDGAIRVSTGTRTSLKNIDDFLAAFQKIIQNSKI
ncbi:Aminotransferase class V domain [Bartonella choladocola]|uniref:cysteine desulfurase family protein n=1 Tax=Bartonella choladocola TaxID=2750995 RepID=UPI00399891A8